MRPRYGAKNGDEDHQDRAGWKRVAAKRERDVPGEAFGHDAGADHGRDQQGGTKRLRRQSAPQIKLGHQLAFSWPFVAPSPRPISRSLVPSDRRSMLSKGKLVKMAIRFLR